MAGQGRLVCFIAYEVYSCLNKSMFRYFKKSKKTGENAESIKEIAEREMKKNAEVLKSLRDYDTGKKNISTRDLQRRVRNIQSTLRK